MNKRPKSNSIRIIGGRWRGRRLPVIDSEGLRPTTDRVRETLFNWLMHDIQNASCLDAFAGSGALGLECLSRGADFVQFVELQPSVANSLRSNIDSLNVLPSQADVFQSSAIDFLAKPATQQFNVVFLDPPFSSDLLDESLNLVIENQWLAKDGLVYLEQPSDLPPVSVPPKLDVYRQASAGRSRYCLYAN